MINPPAMETDKIPINQLPYGFKKRVADLTPINALHKLRQTCPELDKLCSSRLEVHDKLYITDSEIVHQWATKRLFIYRIYKWLFWLFRWSFDCRSFNPTWHSVLYVDDIVKNNRPIFIFDTLVVHCQSIETFEKMIPFICGKFTRLMIHGHVIKLDQLKRLLLGNVRKVEITAKIELESDEFDDAVQLILGSVRDKWFNFNLLSTPQLIARVQNACANHETLMVKFAEADRCNVQHRKTPLDGNLLADLHLFLVIFINSEHLFLDKNVFSMCFLPSFVFACLLVYLFYVVTSSKPENTVCF
uniref:F-box domain-containing protein n=1 Tax=Panagrellus redivivus TaxID=6233 RepID=A0A7E4VZF0_PANRE